MQLLYNEFFMDGPLTSMLRLKDGVVFELENSEGFVIAPVGILQEFW